MAKGGTGKIQIGHAAVHLQSLSKVLAALCCDPVDCWAWCWCMWGSLRLWSMDLPCRGTPMRQGKGRASGQMMQGKRGHYKD